MSNANHSDFKEKRCWSCKYYNCEVRKIEKFFYGECFVTSSSGFCSQRVRGKISEVSSNLQFCSEYERALDVELYLKNKKQANERFLNQNKNQNRLANEGFSSNNYEKNSTAIKTSKSIRPEEAKKYGVIFGIIVGVVLLIVIGVSLSQCSLFKSDKTKLLTYIDEKGDSSHHINANEYSGSDYINFEITYKEYTPETINDKNYEFISHASFVNTNVSYENFNIYFYFNLNGGKYELNGLSKGTVSVFYSSIEDYVTFTFDSVNIDKDIILLSTLGHYTFEPTYEAEISGDFNETHVRSLSEVYFRQLLGATTSLFKKANIGLY